jgi:Zn finger protein HypA/HybF involved in hydrogenase expression
LFQALSQGTMAEGAELVFEARSADYGCWSCGHVLRSEQEPQACPRCDATAVHRFMAPELALVAIDVPAPAGFTPR